jgi:PKD repeat protein
LNIKLLYLFNNIAKKSFLLTFKPIPKLIGSIETIMNNNFINTYLRKLSPLILLAGLGLFLFNGNLLAANVNLTWNASPSSNVGGYIVSYGQSSGNYTSSIDVGNTTTYALSGLITGSTYYFAVNTYDSTKTAYSAYSNEVTLTIPVSTALTADFTPSTTIGSEGFLVNFTPVTTGAVTSWAWSFPGSYTPSVTNSTAQIVSVTYPTAGTYSVSLTATGPSGSVTKTYPNLITVTAPPPPPISSPVIIPDPISTTSLVGLVAAYGFEDINGTTVADASGNANHGTITNAVSITSGHSGDALQFNGTDAWITVNDSASLNLTTGMTLEAWVYPTAPMTQWTAVMMKEQPNQQVYTLYANTASNKPAVDPYINGSEQLLSGGKQLSPNKWWHLVGTYDGQNQRLYVNGTQVAIKAQSGVILTSTGALRIGGDNIWDEYFNGYIDEVRIYNRALTPEEVNYNMATAVSVSNPAHFVMGDNTLEPWINYKPQGVAQAFQVIPQNTSVVTTVQVYLDAGSTATELVAGVYDSNNGHPGTLVAQGKLSVLQYGAWNSVPIPVTPVTNAQPYWIAILGSNGQIGFLNRKRFGTSVMETSASSTLTSLPDTWNSSSIHPNSTMSVFGLGY